MHVRRALALTVTVPLLLAGCSDPAEPTPKMPESTSSSPSPTESETPEAESPEDFIRRWQAASDAMQQTGETSEYLEISPRCAACKSLADNVQDIYDEGGRIEFDGSQVLSLKPSGKTPPTYDVDLDLAKTLIYRDGQTEPETLPAGEMSIRVTLKKVRGSWAVTHYGVL